MKRFVFTLGVVVGFVAAVVTAYALDEIFNVSSD